MPNPEFSQEEREAALRAFNALELTHGQWDAIVVLQCALTRANARIAELEKEIADGDSLSHSAADRMDSGSSGGSDSRSRVGLAGNEHHVHADVETTVVTQKEEAKNGR